MQGGIHPDLPGTAYFDIVREVKKRVPDMHVHAFSPMEVVNGASRTGLSIREWLTEAKAAGLGSIPGTAAEILDDDVRWLLTKGKLPAATWIEVITTAHEVGLRSSSTMMYGHVDNPSHWLGHFRTLARIQRETGGFTEFVGLPFIHTNAPIYLAGVARPGPTERENRVVHAMARILLHGLIDNVQCSWVKLGVGRCRGAAHRRRERPRRHADGGDDQPHGRQPARFGQDRRAARRDRRRRCRDGVPCSATRSTARSAPSGLPPRNTFTGTLPSVVAAR